MRKKYIVPGKIDCERIKQCKDYKKSWFLGESPSRCMRCKNNKNAKEGKVVKKSYFEAL